MRKTITIGFVQIASKQRVFNPKKLDLLDQLNVVKTIVQAKYPSIINAYYSKEQSALFNLYMNIGPDDTKEMLGIADDLWNGIKKIGFQF